MIFFLFSSWWSFCFIEHHHHYSPLTLSLLQPCLSVWHGQPPNGLEIHVEKKSLVPPLHLSLSENQNKRWRQHTAPLMATLGSATKVSLNRLVHHFGFVHHDRDLCVRQWFSSTLCFYPQMDVPLVGLLLLECIIPLNNFWNSSLFIDLCLWCNAGLC